ncbi:DUF4169 family protein [Pyruvatibacter sp.]|uniref:DUF4169 family protein n=1 Tax=Pyruvatibacter sp. TaxID=1981328 RepID=UPI0032EC9738
MTQKDDETSKVVPFARRPSRTGAPAKPRHLRKQQARAEKAAHAAANRARYGRTKSEKQADRADTQRIVKLVDGAKRNTTAGDADKPET